MEQENLLKDSEFDQINQLYDECLNYLKNLNGKDDCDKYFIPENFIHDLEDPGYETIKIKHEETSSDENTCECDGKSKENNEKFKNKNANLNVSDGQILDYDELNYKVENELLKEIKSDRLRRLSQQLPKIVITQSNTSINIKNEDKDLLKIKTAARSEKKQLKVNNGTTNCTRRPTPSRRQPYGDFQKRMVSKSGIENVAQISNVPFEKIRLLNDTFHTLINLRWRWIVMGTVVVHFTIWLVFAVFWYIAALAHYDFAPDPPARSCVTGGKDFLTIFLASVEAQTTIGFGDRAIDEECPESIFLFIMQLILGTGLSGVLTCVVYAKLTRPEKLSRDGVGFSKKAVICIRDGQLCLMIRAWDLNYDHIICSEFSAHFVNTYKTKEGEIIRYYARNLPLQQRQFLLWPVTLVHVIDHASPLYRYTPDLIANNNYEITVSLKGASASMGTFTQSQTSYTPREVVWGHRFPPVVKYDGHKQKYVIDHKKLDAIEPVDTPFRSASQLDSSNKEQPPTPSPSCPDTPSNFSEKISAFVLERTSSFRTKKNDNQK